MLLDMKLYFVDEKKTLISSKSKIHTRDIDNNNLL